MKALINLLLRFWHWITLRSAKEELPTLKNKSNLVKKSRKPKKVSEMTQAEKNFHFLEQRHNWLMKSGYNLRIHIPEDPKPDKGPSHYRAMMNKCHKISEGIKGWSNRPMSMKFGQDNGGLITDKSDVNKYGIRLGNYGL